MTHTLKEHKLVLDVNRSLLQWAIERSGKNVDELSKKPYFKKLNEWLAGTKKPTPTQLEKFAIATYTPFGHLLLSEPPQEFPSSIPHFRTINNGDPQKRSINLEDTIRIVEQRQEWMRDYLIELGVEPLEFVKSNNVDDDPVNVANNIRNTLGLTSNWIDNQPNWREAQRHLLDQMENKRIFVSKNTMVQNNRYRPLDPEEFRGFVLVDQYAPFVFVNGADVDGAQMFTLAHELAHIWMGKSASFDLHGLSADPTNRLENVCNKIAAEFLVPTTEIRQKWRLFNTHDDPFKMASKHFKVSSIVAARRALDTDLISQMDFNDFYRRCKQKNTQKRKGRPPFDVLAPTRISKRFLKTIVTAIGENKILYRDAYFLTGLNSETFDRISNKIRNKGN